MHRDRTLATSLRAMALAAAACVSGCVDGELRMANPFASSPPPAPATPVASVPSRGAAIQEGQRCGMAMGYAVRCNLLHDDRDFAVLRFAVLQGLDRRYGSQLTQGEVAEVVDLATLDRITSIGTCSIPPEDLARTEAGLRSVIEGCASGP